MTQFLIALTENEVNTVLSILGEQPYNKIAPLMASVFNQAQQQAEAMKQPKTITVPEGTSNGAQENT